MRASSSVFHEPFVWTNFKSFIIWSLFIHKAFQEIPKYISDGPLYLWTCWNFWPQDLHLVDISPRAVQQHKCEIKIQIRWLQRLGKG
jgi:hypothetical protein